ncbi:ATP-binding cassette domain-containing protein [Streptomyces sp. NPDC088400]|uniref:ABC transporter ATP-binding protein n=1 Tax=Streptomyces sp. NPDC088400 TaxID=3365861 RepID=UPI00381F322B
MSFTGVIKNFGAVRAVDGVDLGIPRGETVALLGRNGAGKSTTIGMLLGLDEPDAGTVRLFGGPPARAVAAGQVGAMLQDARPIKRVTVRELVAFVASTFPRPLPVAESLDLAGLTEYADRRVDRLSGGQLQRVRFAVALAGSPELIVLDEPTAALDVEARRAFWTSMRAYAERGNTVLFSTHYLEEADANADRIVVIDHGRIVADGTSELIKSAAGGHLVSVDLAGRTTEEFGLLPGVGSVEVRGGRALLRTDDSDATVVALAGLDAIRGLEVTPATLEDAFLKLTNTTTGTGTGTGTTATASTKEAA